MTTETFTKISRLYDHDADISNEEAKKTIARAIKPDKKLNFLPVLKTTPKRVLLITPPGTRMSHFVDCPVRLGNYSCWVWPILPLP